MNAEPSSSRKGAAPLESSPPHSVDNKTRRNELSPTTNNDQRGSRKASYSSPSRGTIDDDSASKVFTFTITDEEKNEIPVVGVMLLQEHGDSYSYLRLVLPQEFAEPNSDMLDEIGDSFQVDPNAEF